MNLSAIDLSSWLPSDLVGWILALYVVFLCIGGLVTGGYFVVAIWRDKPVFADGYTGALVEIGHGDAPWPERETLWRPRRPFDWARDRWDW